MATTEYDHYPMSWSPDGQLLAFFEINPTTGYDIWVLRMAERKAEPFLRTPFNEESPRFSPDGRWVAYASDESGQAEVYVRPFPAGEGKWRISNDGGFYPRWRRDGKEIYYWSSSRTLMTVPVKLSSVFEAGAPQSLFTARPYDQGPLANVFTYAASADGQRFLVNTIEGDPTLNVIVNWEKAAGGAK